MINVRIKGTRNLFIVIISSLFIMTFVLAALSGLGVSNAFIWTIFGVLAIWYPGELVADQVALNSVLLIAADAVAAIDFVILTAFLTAMFYNFIRGTNLKQRATMRKIRLLSNHVIIAPLNGFAEVLSDELSRKGVESVLITDTDREARRMHAHGKLAVVGSASNTELLEAIRLHDARAVVLCSDDPTENATAAVTVKTLNKRIKIIARVNKDEDLPKLSKAGVHVVILPEMAAGTWLGGMLSEKAMPAAK